MTSTENANTPTDAERETAMRVMAWEPLDYAAFANAVNNGHHPDDRDALETVDAIAQALADQRAKYEHLADHLECLAGTCASVAEDSRDAGMAEVATYAGRPHPRGVPAMTERLIAVALTPAWTTCAVGFCVFVAAYRITGGLK